MDGSRDASDTLGWMLCQYSRCGPVSSEKHDPAAEAGADEGGGDAAGVMPITVVNGEQVVYPRTF
jgi:hypothetical protein